MISQKEIKGWVEKLRSGKYKQGNLFLCSKNNRYCCLGVLAEHLKEWETDEKTWRENQAAARRARGGSNSWLSFDLLPETTQTALAQMNDRKNSSFEEIADWIEKTYLLEDQENDGQT